MLIEMMFMALLGLAMFAMFDYGLGVALRTRCLWILLPFAVLVAAVMVELFIVLPQSGPFARWPYAPSDVDQVALATFLAGILVPAVLTILWRWHFNRSENDHSPFVNGE